MKFLIEFYYRLGVPDKTQKENGAERVSCDGLAQIFVRRKATISEGVNHTETVWEDFQHSAR